MLYIKHVSIYKGNEHLVSEYEKSLAEVTSFKGQVLKLESTLLESQIKTPINKKYDQEPELEYWKRYICLPFILSLLLTNSYILYLLFDYIVFD